MNVMSQYDQAVHDLIQGLGSMRTAMPDLVAKLEQAGAWRALLERHQVRQAQPDRPALVAVLYGPTGAGKSTFFRLLTGCDVPAGSDRRPMSYACCVAVPEPLAADEPLARLFPGYRVQRLDSPDQLSDPQSSPDILYYMPYPAHTAPGELPLILADVPDFNSVERSNWDKARRMLERAEIVLFLTYDEAYKNRDTVDHLQRCCELSGFLAYLLTKCSVKSARAKLADLREHLQKNDPAFAQRRLTGEPLHAFFSRSPAYASPRAAEDAEPTLDAVAALDEASPAFASLLQGQDQQRIILESLLQPARQAVAEVEPILDAAAARAGELAWRIEQADDLTQQAGREVAQAHFPMSEFFQILIDEVNEHQWKLARWMSAPLYRTWAVLSKTRQWVRQLRDHEAVRPRREAEQQRLATRAQVMLERARDAFSDQARHDGLLAEPRLRDAVARFVTMPPPEPATDWHDAVRTAMHDWCVKHPGKLNILPVVLGSLTVGGLGIFVLDLTVTGGLGTLTTGGTGAGLTGAAALLAKLLHQFGLHRVAEVAYERWTEQRAREMAAHLRKQLLGPLIYDQWLAAQAALDEKVLKDSRRACETLRRLHAEHSDS